MTVFDMPKTGTWEQRGGWVVRALMAEFGLTDTQAAGLVGNLGFESVGFRTLQEMEPAVRGSKGGFGWAQWTGPRRRFFEAWCTAHHLPMASDEANYGFLLHELRGEDENNNHRGTLAALKRTTTIEKATFSVGQTYERPGGTTPDHLPGYAERLTFARRALAGARGAKVTMREPPSAISPREMIKRLQVTLGVVSDGHFGPRSRAALSAVLTAAGQPGI